MWVNSVVAHVFSPCQIYRFKTQFTHMKKLSLFLVTGVLALAVSSCKECAPTTDGGGDKLKLNKDNALAVFEAFNTGDVSKLDSIISPEAIDHTMDTMFHLQNTQGAAMYKELIGIVRTANPDMKSTADIVVAEGDYVAIWGKMSGTNTGPMGPMPATGKHFDVYSVDVMKFNDKGVNTDHWGLMDMMTMMTQLGMMGGDSAAAPPAGGNDH